MSDYFIGGNIFCLCFKRCIRKILGYKIHLFDFFINFFVVAKTKYFRKIYKILKIDALEALYKFVVWLVLKPNLVNSLALHGGLVFLQWPDIKIYKQAWSNNERLGDYWDHYFDLGLRTNTWIGTLFFLFTNIGVKKFCIPKTSLLGASEVS